MRYPTVTDEGAKILLAEYEVGVTDNLAIRTTWLGDGDEVDLAELGRIVAPFEQELAVDGAPGDWDPFEGRLAAGVHASMNDVPIQVLDDHQFWAYLSFRYFWWFTSRREAGPIANGNGLRYVQNRAPADAIPIRLFLRGQAALLAGDYRPASSLVRSADLWRSHVLRVRTGSAPTVTRAFVELQERVAMRTERTLRPFARRLNRTWTNVLLHTYDEDRASALMQQIHDETMERIAESTT